MKHVNYYGRVNRVKHSNVLIYLMLFLSSRALNKIAHFNVFIAAACALSSSNLKQSAILICANLLIISMFVELRLRNVFKHFVDVFYSYFHEM